MQTAFPTHLEEQCEQEEKTSSQLSLPNRWVHPFSVTLQLKSWFRDNEYGMKQAWILHQDPDHLYSTASLLQTCWKKAEASDPQTDALKQTIHWLQAIVAMNTRVQATHRHLIQDWEIPLKKRKLPLFNAIQEVTEQLQSTVLSSETVANRWEFTEHVRPALLYILSAVRQQPEYLPFLFFRVVQTDDSHLLNWYLRERHCLPHPAIPTPPSVYAEYQLARSNAARNVTCELLQILTQSPLTPASDFQWEEIWIPLLDGSHGVHWIEIPAIFKLFEQSIAQQKMLPGDFTLFIKKNLPILLDSFCKAPHPQKAKMIAHLALQDLWGAHWPYIWESISRTLYENEAKADETDEAAYWETWRYCWHPLLAALHATLAQQSLQATPKLWCNLLAAFAQGCLLPTAIANRQVRMQLSQLLKKSALKETIQLIEPYCLERTAEYAHMVKMWAFVLQARLLVGDFHGIHNWLNMRSGNLRDACLQHPPYVEELAIAFLRFLRTLPKPAFKPLLDSHNQEASVAYANAQIWEQAEHWIAAYPLCFAEKDSAFWKPILKTACMRFSCFQDPHYRMKIPSLEKMIYTLFPIAHQAHIQQELAKALEKKALTCIPSRLFPWVKVNLFGKREPLLPYEISTRPPTKPGA